jgi:hypothetical protein
MLVFHRTFDTIDLNIIITILIIFIGRKIKNFNPLLNLSKYYNIQYSRMIFKGGVKRSQSEADEKLPPSVRDKKRGF